MLKHNKFLQALGLFILVFAASFAVYYFFRNEGRSSMIDQSNGLQLSSPVFREGVAIPAPYTCKGQSVSPPLNIVGVPNDAKSLALLMHDPDAVSGDFVHWLVWDIPTSTESVAAGSLPVGAVQGQNSAGTNVYFGPCPPAGTGTHRYIFELYALDTTLGLSPNTTRDDLKKAIEGHTLARANLIGLVKAD